MFIQGGDEGGSGGSKCKDPEAAVGLVGFTRGTAPGRVERGG
jgi:hypothetical protein